MATTYAGHWAVWVKRPIRSLSVKAVYGLENPIGMPPGAHDGDRDARPSSAPEASSFVRLPPMFVKNASRRFEGWTIRFLRRLAQDNDPRTCKT